MAGHITADIDALLVDPRDHVVTALREIKSGETISFQKSGEVHSLEALQTIPFGHKIAIINIELGSHIRKYGEVIGRATSLINIGEHVHIQNVEGIRGRGDQAHANNDD